MFSRWRNLAAAAGAICLPFAFAQAAPRLDDLHCTRPATCARFHERTITDEQIEFDQDNWYRRYYGDTLNESTSNEVTAPRSEDPENYGATGTTSNDDEYEGQYAPTFNQSDNPTDDFSDAQTPSPIGKTEVDSLGRCSDPTCPCHTIVDLDCDEEDATDAPAADAEPAQRPVAFLTGTIEPIFDEPNFDELYFDELSFDASEDEAMNSDIPEAGSTTSEPTTPSIDEPVSGDETSGEASIEACGDSEVRPSSVPTNYHMFYPGCDWSAYDPSMNPEEEPETPSQPVEQPEPAPAPAPAEPAYVPSVETLLLIWF